MLALSGAAAAAPGDLDPTFGSGGQVLTDFDPGGENAQAVVLQPDGKIVVAIGGAFFGVARYHADGTVDTSFAGDGKATTTFNGLNGFAAAVALQDDGKIVVGGSTSAGFAIARYEPDGALDTTFDGDGTLTTPFGAFSGIAHVLVQPDGKIVAAGGMFSPGGSGFAVARYNPNGSLDMSFDGDGRVVTSFNGLGGGAGSVALQPDGKIVAAGSAPGGNGQADFALARYNPDGSLDTTFDGDGRVTMPTADNDAIDDLVIQPDGKLLATGVGGIGVGFKTARYQPDGALDLGFGDDGVTVTRFFGADIEGARGVSLQADGRIVVAGEVTSPAGEFAAADRKFALARYLADGTPDGSFGDGGRLTTDFGDASNDSAADVAIQPDGRILAVGGAGPCLPRCLTALARYESDGEVDLTPPVITSPVSVSVNATHPDGATVIYEVSAVDEVDGPVAVTCAPPSGSTFAIGSTVVTCSASDSSGNTAHAQFPVAVAGAEEQLAELLELVTGIGPGTSLADKVQSARAALQAGDVRDACERLVAFAYESQAQSGKKLTAEQARDLAFAAARIRAVLAC